MLILFKYVEIKLIIKMKTVFVVLLILSVTFAANMRQQRASIKGLQELKQSKWGMTLLKMIQMHTSAKGAV